MFLAIHLVLAYVGLTARTMPWGDVTVVYHEWVKNGFDGYWVGLDGPFVYPLLALAPMIGAAMFGLAQYGIGWFVLVLLANAAVLAFILNSRSTTVAPEIKSDSEPSAPASGAVPDARQRGFGLNIRFVAAWWWLAFLLLLGPVALGRIDTFEVDLVIVGLLLAIRRPAVAGVLLSAATWVKVWPAALIVAVVVAAKKRVTVAVAAALSAVAIAVVGLALGAGANLFSFIGQQTSRGLQIEAPVSTPWMWFAYFRPRSEQLVYYDYDILTFQVKGPGASLAEAVTTPLLAIAVAAVLLLSVWVVRTGASITRVLPPLSLALVMALIVFNKVGSPQFVLWISAPIILGLIWQGRGFRTFAIIAAVLAVLTQAIYPYYYDWLISLDVRLLVVLAARNLLYCVLFVLAVRSLVTARVKTPVPVPTLTDKVSR